MLWYEQCENVQSCYVNDMLCYVRPTMTKEEMKGSLKYKRNESLKGHIILLVQVLYVNAPGTE